MKRQHITLSPDGDFVIVSVVGRRTPETAKAANKAFLEFYRDNRTDRILFDTVGAYAGDFAGRVLDWAMDVCQEMPTARVAVLAKDYDCAFARMWRRALQVTGHEVELFDHAGQAEAWLTTPADADLLYVH